MARCNDAACSCVVHGGPGVSIIGAGTPANPYVVTVDQAGQISVVDTQTVDLSLTPPSDEDNPAELTATLTANLGDLQDVAKGAPTTGQVLAWTGSQWAPVPPSTSTPGAIAVSTGLTGDGSSGSPLHPVVDPAGGLVINTLGLAVSPATLQRITDLETKRYDPQYLRVERTDALSLVDATWTVPVSFNLGTTKKVGTRLSYGSGYITVLDAGVYAWETSCTFAGIVAQTSQFCRAGCIQVNDVNERYGQTTHYYAKDVTAGLAVTFQGTVSANANDKLRPAYYSNLPSNAASSVVPNSFNVYRVA